MWLESFQPPRESFRKPIQGAATPGLATSFTIKPTCPADVVETLHTGISDQTDPKHFKAYYHESCDAGSYTLGEHLRTPNDIAAPQEEPSTKNGAIRSSTAFEISEHVGRQATDGNLHQNFVHLATRSNVTWPIEKEQILLGPYEYVEKQPGENVRG